MKPILICLVSTILLFALDAAAQSTASPNNRWKSVEAAMGRDGQIQPDGVMKFGFPRNDMKVTVQGIGLKSGLALGSWVAFDKVGHGAMAMGDLVLTEDEVEPVMMKLVESDIAVTALHNHLLGETPRVMYMHIAGYGDAEKLANSIHAAISMTKTPAPAPAAKATAPDGGFGIDIHQIETILGRKGKVNGGIFQVGVPRSEAIFEHGSPIPKSMGISTALNFQPTGGGKAAITGDFVLLGSEVNVVMRTLRQSGIEVEAVHSHMLMEEPRLFFMHFWANDDATKLARGLRAALDKTNSSAPTAP